MLKGILIAVSEALLLEQTLTRENLPWVEIKCQETADFLMALERLGENKVVQLDEERKAAMVSNLLVVLCGNRDAQPVVNSGSLY